MCWAVKKSPKSSQQTSGKHVNWHATLSSKTQENSETKKTFTTLRLFLIWKPSASLFFLLSHSFLIPNNIITYCDPKCDMSIDWSEVNERRRMWNGLHKTAKATSFPTPFPWSCTRSSWMRASSMLRDPIQCSSAISFNAAQHRALRLHFFLTLHRSRLLFTTRLKWL